MSDGEAKMRGSRKFKGSLIGIVVAIFSFACMPLAFSSAETVTYTYDSMNRLSRADYASGVSITYGYDGMGNMTQRTVASTDTSAPTAPVIASPMNGGVVNASNVTLSGTAEVSSMVKVYDGAALLGGVTADATGAWAYTTTLLADGSYSFSATATDAAGNTSGASTVVVATIQTTAPTTTASTEGGTYNSTQSVTLNCFDGSGSGCDKIYYTIDGSTPTTASSIYNAPISISSTTTLKYFATDLLGHSEAVKSQAYSIDSAPPVTTASPPGGNYSATQSVTLTCNDSESGCGNIYYTTDGITPTTSSSVYSAPINMNMTTTLKYFAMDLASNSEAVKNETYTIPNCYWINPAGGNWSTASNWSCGHVPITTDNVFITLNGTYTVTLDTNTTVSTLTIQSLSGRATLLATNRTLTINGPSAIGTDSAVSLYSSTISGTGSITNSGTISLKSSTINAPLVNAGAVNVYGSSTISGALTTQSGSLLYMQASTSCNPDSSILTIANGFTNNGGIELIGQSSGACGNNATAARLEVTSGTLLNTPSGSINSQVGSGLGYRELYAAVNNQGTITVSHPLTISKSAATHANSGTINVNANLTVSQSGTSASFTNSGAISIASGRTLSVNGRTFNQNTGAIFSGAGATLSLNNATANMQTAIGVSALSLTSSTANLTSDIDLGSLSLGLNSATVNGPVTITNPAGNTFVLINSTVNTALVNAGTVNAYGTSAIGGALTMQSSSLLHLETNSSCGVYLTVANGFANSGTIELVGQNSSCGGSSTATLAVTNGTLVNTVGGSIVLPAGYGTRTLAAAVNNQGTITVSHPLAISKSSAVHANSGLISIASDKTVSVSNGTFTNASSGILSGSGTLSFSSATFANSGTINPGSNLGKLTITGSLPQTATSVVNMGIGGTVAGTNYDQLAISGAATLNGTLNVSLANGFTPNTGDSFTIMTYGSKIGAFSAVNLPPMGKMWNTTYNPTSLVLSVGDACPPIPISPASLPLLTVGMAFSQSITATGGVGSYAYSVTNGSLPSGLTLSADGVLSGTPDAPGTYTFTVSATDANYCAGSVSYTVMVQTPCISPLSGLVSWWQGEGDAGDQMSRNTGTLINGTGFITGKVGQSFAFDGIDDGVSAPTTGLPVADGDRTMAMWVRIDQPVATDAVFAGYGTAGAGDQLYVLGATGGGNTFLFSNGTTSLTGPDLQNGRWYHVAVTNSGNLVTLYLDGAVVAGGTLDLSTPANSQFFIGYLDAYRKLSGAVDEVQVFDRALSATEIAGIAHTGGNGLCDTVAPTMLFTIPANGATNAQIYAPVTATFSEAMDAATMNTANFTVSGGAGMVTFDAASKTTAFTPSAALAYATTYTATITSGVKDPAGNALAADYSWSFTTEPSPDATPPTTSASPAGGTYNSPQNVRLTCSDGAGSGCDNIYYTLDGSTPTTASTVYTSEIIIGTTTTLKYFSTDLAGNSEAVRSQTYTFDATAPTGSITINSGAASTNSTGVTLILTCTDASGCSEMQFSDNNVNWSAAEAYATTRAWTLPAGDGTKTVYARFMDAAGNWSAAYSDTISLKTYDLTVTAVSAPTTGNITQQVSVSYTVKNQGSSSVGSFNTGIYLSTDATVSTADTFLGYDTVTSLSAGAQTTRSKSVRIPAGMMAGTYYIGAIADYASVVVETDESNNSRSGSQIAITAAPPDLTITAVSGPASANATQQVTISTTVKNLGGTTGGFDIDVYLSADAVIDAGDTFLGTAAIGTLSAGAQTTSNPAVRILAGVPAGTYYVLALADSGNVITEANEDNNALAGNLIVITADLPDLTVSAVSCPASANITEPVMVSATVKNLCGITNAFSVKIYLSTDAVITAGDRLLGTISFTDSIPAGGDIPLTAAFRLSNTTPAGTYHVGAMADSGGVITEVSEGNNTLAGNQITTTSQKPDLIITTVAGPTSSNITELVTVSTTVKNLGGTTGDFSVRIYLSTDAVITTADKLLGTISVPDAIPTNGEIPLAGSFRIPTSVAAGVYTLGAIADPTNQVAELTETNNAQAGNSMVTTAAYPDLTVTVVAGPTTGMKGQPITVSSAIRNHGGATGGFYVGIYLSTDATITTSDTRIGTWYVDSVAGGAESTNTVSFTIPATMTSRDYYIGAIADYSKAVSEASETNNALAGNRITITQ